MFKANPEKQDTTILKTKSVTERITEVIIIHPVCSNMDAASKEQHFSISS